jgi:hypothetical protein
MKLLRLLALLMCVAFASSGCVTAYDCGNQSEGDPKSFEACRQVKGTPAFHYCLDNHRYKTFAECAEHATKPGAENCVTRKAPRPEIFECLNGQGPALVSEKEKQRARPLPKLQLEDDPKPTSKGTGQFVTGIVFTAVGPALGLAAYVSLKNLDCQKEDEGKDRDECEDAKAEAPQAGVIYTGLGLGIGLPLLFSGIEKRRLYREWQERHPEQATTRLDLMPTVGGGLAALLTIPLD